MKIPKKLKAFGETELNLLVEIIKKIGIIGEWEEPLISHCGDVKVWGYEELGYIKHLTKLDMRLVENSSGTDRILYNPNIYTLQQARAYGDKL